MEQTVVGVPGQSELDAVQCQPVTRHSAANAACHRPPLGRWPPGIEEVKSELNQIESQVLARDPGPSLRLWPPLECEAEIDSEFHALPRRCFRCTSPWRNALFDSAHCQAAHQVTRDDSGEDDDRQHDQRACGHHRAPADPEPGHEIGRLDWGRLRFGPRQH